MEITGAYNNDRQIPRETRDDLGSMGLMDRKLLEMIAHAAAGEASAVNYYKWLSNYLIAPEDKKTVHDIMLDEAKHRRLFEELYYSLAGARMKPVESGEPERDSPYRPYPAIFEERLMDELHDAEFYRQIYFALVNLDYRDILFEIITDETRHAQLMTYLYAKYN